ncbi:MAG: hypothetical protein ACREU1_11775 [Burkholderiales bacterium]
MNGGHLSPHELHPDRTVDAAHGLNHDKEPINRRYPVMDGGMGSMMGWMMGLGWLAALLVVILLIGAVIAVVLMLRRSDAKEPRTTAGANAATIVLIVLAVIGALALLGLLAMFFMPAAMMGR